MYMYVCLYLFVYVYMYALGHAGIKLLALYEQGYGRLKGCMCVYVMPALPNAYIYTYTNKYKHTYIALYEQGYGRLKGCMCVCLCLCMYVCMYVN